MSVDSGKFTVDVKDFLKLDDELKGVSKEIRGLKTNKSSLEDRISKHMEDNNIPETFSDVGKIKIYKSKSNTPFNKALVEEASLELFGSDQTQRLMNHIESKREVTEKTRIKRMSAGVSK